jgi:outer membrane scaffolding protein for murein synthesis (MipA/OmpV family)
MSAGFMPIQEPSLFNPRPTASALAAATAAFLLVPQLSLAQQQAGPGPSATPWAVGLGVATSQRPYAGDSSKTIPFPFVSYENDYFRIAGIGADLKLGAAGPVTFALRAKYAFADGYKSGDAPILNGMQDRKGSLWLGPAVQWKTDIAKLSFEVLGDTLGRSKGIEARLGAEHDFRAGSFMFTPHVAAEFVDRKYVDYYYGVTASEATANRAAYEGKSTVNVDAGLRAAFMIDPSNSVFVDAGAKALGKGITDSPLVDRKTTATFAAGYIYRF